MGNKVPEPSGTNGKIMKDNGDKVLAPMERYWKTMGNKVLEPMERYWQTMGDKVAEPMDR